MRAPVWFEIVSLELLTPSQQKHDETKKKRIIGWVCNNNNNNTMTAMRGVFSAALRLSRSHECAHRGASSCDFREIFIFLLSKTLFPLI